MAAGVAVVGYCGKRNQILDRANPEREAHLLSSRRCWKSCWTTEREGCGWRRSNGPEPQVRKDSPGSSKANDERGGVEGTVRFKDFLLDCFLCRRFFMALSCPLMLFSTRIFFSYRPIQNGGIGTNMSNKPGRRRRIIKS